MASRLNNFFSRNNKSNKASIVQSKEVFIPQNCSNWTIPEARVETLYRIGTFDFQTAFCIKTHKETVFIQEEFQTIPLLSSTSLNKYLERGFRYSHIGIIQVAVKPLVVHLGFDAPIYLALRDNRLKVKEHLYSL